MVKLKTICIFLMLAVFISGITFSIARTSLEQDYSLICTTDQLSNYIENMNPHQVFVDVRSQEDYEKGHIDGFINIPSENGDEVLNYLRDHNITKKHIYLMCYSGKRAAITFELLRTNGFRYLSYIVFGYDTYVAEQEGFEPKVGPCNCLADD